ncbi:hypothetical protein [Micromonospora sp. WMMD712]|uniref:hypothetical protein n=1 Tax=Micromonospora sp. WMMD712 TaxID=3016096 RepID=UPI00249B54E4|nr:hypothetical protein [Micromonospora sp. WMMD712]WFE58096.1 hypothetical protein O7633_15090 [Micromonospora sp. WMMD712]
MIFKLAFLCLVLMVLGLAAVFTVWYLANWLRWSVPRAVVSLGHWAVSLPRRMGSLTVDSPQGRPFNDSRDVWPTPTDD